MTEFAGVKLRNRGEDRRRTVEVMLKPDEKASQNPLLSPTEKAERPKSFHELVAGFEAQASPLFRKKKGVWKQLRKTSSEEGLHIEK